MIRRTCGIKATDILLKDILGTDDIITVLQWNRLQWYARF